jgi:hypothetical protein
VFGKLIFGTELKWEKPSPTCRANTFNTLSLPSATTSPTEVIASAATNETPSGNDISQEQ